MLAEETHLREEAKKAKVNLMTELVALHDQEAKDNAMAEFPIS